MKTHSVSRVPYLTVLLVGVLTFTQCLSAMVNIAYAAPVTGFDAGDIIDDSVFYNKSSMSVKQIQYFLDNLIPNCDVNGTQPSGYGNLTDAQYAQQVMGWPAPPYVCLNKYYENPTTGDTSYEKGGGAFDGGISAAQIIYDAAQTYNINPQVLLVILKKESLGPLTADSWPLKSQYKYAMGYACPDSGPNYSANCDSDKAGFYKQVTTAAWQLNYYRQHPNDYRYSLGWNDIAYSTDPSCGTKHVYIQNIATLSLYIYTPYTPNDAALANYPGQATCGSYGNRNFYQYFKEWFGDPSGPRTGLVANIGSGAIASSGYVTSDGIQHVISLKNNGDILETWWSSQSGPRTGLVANIGSGAIASSGYVTSDGIQHVISLKASGEAYETWWGWSGGQYHLATGPVANIGSGAIASSGYVTSDGIQHVISLKASGEAYETWWGWSGGQYHLATGPVANIGSGAIASSGYVTSDGIQHVISLKASGEAYETWWGWSGGQYHLATGPVANIGSGAIASSGYVTSDGIQHVISLKASGEAYETWWGIKEGEYSLSTRPIANIGPTAVATGGYFTQDAIQHAISLKSSGDIFETWWY